ncbi:hypothetical protein DFR29_1198 [Tahibacter aquaticus]|uniref:Uncharacterized protein n=1 Tax=Tahibacter aquaticus TaxID=520092 RepID=A0A4R6YML5_9GAMM|nr:hypothetical protein [Tahibacter aquaticus]TDR38680.1 hypothetical protein DFR29_1198 [Tahibacter aquaticus]
MTTLQEEEVRCKRRLLDAVEQKKSVEDQLVAKEDELEKKGFTPELWAKVDKLQKQRAELISLVSARGAEWREAKANLDAEHQLEERRAREAESQKAREQERAKGKEIDDLEL